MRSPMPAVTRYTLSAMSAYPANLFPKDPVFRFPWSHAASHFTHNNNNFRVHLQHGLCLFHRVLALFYIFSTEN